LPTKKLSGVTLSSAELFVSGERTSVTWKVQATPSPEKYGQTRKKKCVTKDHSGERRSCCVIEEIRCGSDIQELQQALPSWVISVGKHTHTHTHNGATPEVEIQPSVGTNETGFLSGEI